MLLVTEFTTERGETYTVLQLLKRLRRAIIQIDGILFEHQERIEVLEIDVEKLKEDVENIYAELLIINNRLDNIDIRLDNIDIRLDNIDSKIVNIENSINDIEIKITAIENNIDNIENNIDNIEISITDINNTINNITDLIADTAIDITDINNKIDALQIQVDNIPIVSPSALNGYIKIDGNDTLVYLDDGSGTGGNVFTSSKIHLPSKNLSGDDHGTYKNIFKYTIGDEISRITGSSQLVYSFEYDGNYFTLVNEDTTADFQISIGGAILNLGSIIFKDQAKNTSFKIKTDIMIIKNEADDYDISCFMTFLTADPELWSDTTLIKRLFIKETGVVITPQDTLKFNVMLQNSSLNIGWWRIPELGSLPTFISKTGMLEINIIDKYAEQEL